MMPKKILISILLNLSIFIIAEGKSRKVTFSWKEIASCPNFENKITDLSKAAIYMVNETTVGVKGSFEVKEDLTTRPLLVKTVVKKEIGGNYQVLMNHEIADLCVAMASDDTWKPYLNELKPSLNNCPVKKGTYDVTAIRPQSPNIELKKEMAGSYESKIEMFKPKSMVGAPEMWACYTLEFQIDIV